MARYRKLELRFWDDEKVRSLTPPEPNALDLFKWLIVGPCTTAIPGCVRGKPEVLAAELRWPLEGFKKAFQEVCSKMTVKMDEAAGFVWLPNAIKYNRPINPNVVRSWHDTWDTLPECPLKGEAWLTLKTFLESLGQSFAESFQESCPKPSGNQVGFKSHQEQEQEQEQEQDTKTLPLFGSGSPPNGTGPKSSSKKSPLPFRADKALQSIAEGSGNAFKATNPGGKAVFIEKLIRTYPSLATWRVVGEWLGAGAEDWRDRLDSHVLTVDILDAWIAHATEWNASGRPDPHLKRRQRRDNRIPVRTK